MSLQFPPLTLLSLDRYAPLLGSEAMQQIKARMTVFRAQLTGRVVWNVSSTGVSGGVAEMVRSLLAYARGAGVDARWAVIYGSEPFFRITKRLHNAIHGSAGDGSPLGELERRIFEATNAASAAQLAPMVQPHDVVIVHDPQPAGMVPALIERGAHVIWRCHIGQDDTNVEVRRAWQFLAPYLARAHAYVFSRAAYVPALLDSKRAYVIPPTIDPFSPKNQALDDNCIRAILGRAGLIQTTADPIGATFTREDGTPGRVDRAAEVIREGGPPPETTPLVVQVSRWDRLKDPEGVLAGFARLDRDAHLVLAGPSTSGVSDDPEGAEVLAAVTAMWRVLPDAARRRIHLASLPTFDVDENAAIVNALQRHAAIVVQKSLQEGFGLTVTEAMWKSRPVIASAVGGIQDQIHDSLHGILLRDPTDLDAFADALARLLDDRDAAEQMGVRGHWRVIERYLGIDSLVRFGTLIESLGRIERGGRIASELSRGRPA